MLHPLPILLKTMIVFFNFIWLCPTAAVKWNVATVGLTISNKSPMLALLTLYPLGLWNMVTFTVC